MYTGHVEANFESAHKNGPPGHKCAGLLQGVPQSVRDALYDNPRLMSDGDVLYDEIVKTIQDQFDYHGHSWLGVVEWSYGDDKLDEYGWGPDFGAVKDLIRKYDHHNLNLMHPAPSAENLAKAIYYDFIDKFGFAPTFVRLHEGHGNTMTYTEALQWNAEGIITNVR